MLRSIRELQGYAVIAEDGEAGEVETFLFDDEEWAIRYLVVDTGNWLSENLVLVSPVAIKNAAWRDKVVKVGLSKEQIENSPPIESNKPVSRKKEMEISQYYSWPMYWQPSARSYGVFTPPQVKKIEAQGKSTEREEGHLRSVKEVTGYHIKASDGEIGHVEDFIVDDENFWAMRYAVINTTNFIGGKDVLISTQWIDDVDWTRKKVYVDLLKKAIKDSPKFDPKEPVNREYEETLYDFYGRPRYWEND